MGDVGGVGNCCVEVVAAAVCGGMLVVEVAFAEAAVRWWRSFSFFIAFDMIATGYLKKLRSYTIFLNVECYVGSELNSGRLYSCSWPCRML